MSRVHVAFDGIIFPLAKKVVVIEAEDGPVQGAGITWEELDGKVVVTVEFAVRGKEPVHVSLAEDDEGDFEVITPPVYLKGQG